MIPPFLAKAFIANEQLIHLYIPTKVTQCIRSIELKEQEMSEVFLFQVAGLKIYSCIGKVHLKVRAIMFPSKFQLRAF